MLQTPTSVALGRNGTVYIADLTQKIVQAISSSGNTLSLFNFNNTLLGTPGVAVDTGEILYVSDSSHRILKLNMSSGIHTVIAGTGDIAANVTLNEGPGRNISLRFPWGITLDEYSNVYFCDSLSHVVRRVDGTSGNVTVMAGNGSSGFGGDGLLATFALLNRPTGIAIDKNANIFIADCDNHRIRKISLKIKTGEPQISQWMLQPYYNKF